MTLILGDNKRLRNSQITLQLKRENQKFNVRAAMSTNYIFIIVILLLEFCSPIIICSQTQIRFLVQDGFYSFMNKLFAFCFLKFSRNKLFFPFQKTVFYLAR